MVDDIAKIAAGLTEEEDAARSDHLGLAEWVSLNYANQNMSHVDFRVECKRRSDSILGDAS